MLRLALAISCVAVVTAYSITPNFGIGIGGLNADSALTTAVSSLGVAFVGGTTTSGSAGAYTVNSTVFTGGIQGAASSQSAHTYAANTGRNGYIAAFSATGARLWYAEVTGTGDEAVTAMTVDSAGATLYVCGSFTSSDAAYVSPTGTTSTAFTGDATTGTADVFYLVITISTGALQAQGSVHSPLQDVCNAAAYTSFGGGNVVFGGSAVVPVAGVYSGPLFVPVGGVNTGSGAYVGGSLHVIAEPSKAFILDSNSGFGGSVGYWLRVNAAGGGQAIAPTILPSDSLSMEGDWVTALTFDSYGNLYVGYNQWGDGNNWFMTNPSGTPNVQPCVMTVSSAAFASDLAAANSIPWIWGNGSFLTGSTSYLFFPIMSSSLFGSVGDDFVTGIEVLHAMPFPAASTIAISGWTNSTAGTTFNASSYPYPLLPGGTYLPYNTFAHSPSGPLPSAMSSWLVVNNAWMNASNAVLKFLNPAGVISVAGGMALDVPSGDVFVATTIGGAGIFQETNVLVGGMALPALQFSASGFWDAALVRAKTTTGAIQWVQVVASAGDDWGLSAAVVTIPGGTGNAFFRPAPFMAGSFNANMTVGGASTSPITVNSRGATDGFLVSFDDVDDCGFDTNVTSWPWGLNACNYQPSTLTGLGASLCVDQPQYPLCFCNMNVTSNAPGFCNTYGWNCAFTSQYYFDLLNVCNCSQLANPSSNPLNDVEKRLVQCAPNVCSFHSLPAPYSQCLPLVLNFVDYCTASPLTSATDKQLMGAFSGLYATCTTTTASSSSTGTYSFSAAQHTSALPSAATVALAATAAAVAAAAANGNANANAAPAAPIAPLHGEL